MKDEFAQITEQILAPIKTSAHYIFVITILIFILVFLFSKNKELKLGMFFSVLASSVLLLSFYVKQDSGTLFAMAGLEFLLGICVAIAFDGSSESEYKSDYIQEDSKYKYNQLEWDDLMRKLERKRAVRYNGSKRCLLKRLSKTHKRWDSFDEE